MFHCTTISVFDRVILSFHKHKNTPAFCVLGRSQMLEVRQRGAPRDEVENFRMHRDNAAIVTAELKCLLCSSCGVGTLSIISGKVGVSSKRPVWDVTCALALFTSKYRGMGRV